MRRIFQIRLFGVVLLTFALSILVSFVIQTGLSKNQAEALLRERIGYAHEQIQTNSKSLLTVRAMNRSEAETCARMAARILRENAAYAADPDKLSELLDPLHVDEIDIIDGEGRIVCSTDRDVIGYDMAAAAQSAEFLKILDDPSLTVVQEPQQRGYADASMMQYAGVAREDAAGIVQIAFNPPRLQEAMEVADIRNLAPGFHIGTEGEIVVLSGGTVVSSADAAMIGKTLPDLGLPELAGDSAKPVTVTMAGERRLCLAEQSEGYLIVGMLPETEVYATRSAILNVLVLCNLVMFAVLFFMAARLVQREVIDGIYDVNASLKKITEGDLNEQVRVLRNPEFAALSGGINATVGALKDAIAAEKARIDQELEFAKAIQYSSVPNVFPPYPNRKEFEIFALMDTAREVGGDFYDFFIIDNNKLGFVIADVSGKGIGAALYMMQAKTQIKNSMLAGGALDEVIGAVNRNLCEQNGAGMFVTAFVGVCDFVNGSLTYVNAGHNRPLLRRCGGQYEWLRGKRGFVLGAIADRQYRCNCIPLCPGDSLLLYTDGVTEAQNAAQELFGDGRLLTFANAPENADRSAGEQTAALREAVAQFASGAEQADDITILSIAVHPSDKTVQRVTMDADPALIAPAVDFAERVFRRAGCDEKTLHKLDVAIDELLANISAYAYPKNAPGLVTMECSVQGGKAVVTLTDGGIPYDPLEAPDPDVTLSAADRKIGGLGVYLAKKLMDDMRYVRTDGTNRITIEKQIVSDQ